MIDLSVLLITYNNEDYIEDTLKSVLKQKGNFTFEIVVGDDCSTDKTLEIINIYASKYPNLFAVKKNESQLGIINNFKTTLDRCQGRYIFDVAGDDLLYTEDAFESMLEPFRKKPNLGFIDSGYNELDTDTNKLNLYTNKTSIKTDKDAYKKLAYLGLIIPIGTCYNKEALYKHVDFEYYISENITIEDYPILMDLISNCDFEMVDKNLHTYRVHSNSYSHNKTFKRRYFLKNQMLKLFNYFKEKYQFPEEIATTFYESHYKSILFFAGSHEKKQLGKEAFKAIKNKSLKDYLLYSTSQSKIIRQIVRMVYR